MNTQLQHDLEPSDAQTARAARMAPLALLMLASLAFPMSGSGWLWITLLQMITAAALLLGHALRNQLRSGCGPVCMGLVSLGLAYHSLANTALPVRIVLASTLALCIAHAGLRTLTPWFVRYGVGSASYVSGALLLYLCSTSATQEQGHLAAWIVLTACASCYVFNPRAEATTMTPALPASNRTATRVERPELPPPASLTRLQQLEEENDALRATKRDQETFVYAIAHDLRAPLRAIDAFSRLLCDHLAQPLTPRARHDLAGIHAGVGRMQDLLTCWLNIARCDRAKLRRTKVDLTVIAESLGRELQMLEPKRAVLMSVDAELHASADPVLARELLQNLLSNAWKFTAEATPAAVHVGARIDGGETVFYVRDNGVGLDGTDATELFVPFVRSSNAAGFAGTGVGLTIAQHIVERHSGRIWAEGELGGGATFCFTLTAPPQSPV